MLGVLGICLTLAASPQMTPQFVPTESFTLAWTHTIEKTRWEEDYTVQTDGDGEPVLVPGPARIEGSGAGMEPPPDAVKRADGFYEYQPRTPPLYELRLSRSPYAEDYDWCMDGKCRPLQDILPADEGVTILRPCRR